MPDLLAVEGAAAPHGLTVLGWFDARPEDALPGGAGSLALLGPDGARMWPAFRAAAEASDGAPDPLDRWSVRVIGALAGTLGAAALFPFGGPPWHPFISWAQRTGRIFSSPVGLLVHDTAGLMVSFRGALAFPEPFGLPAPQAPSPCAACAGQPCRTACPPAALTPAGYDVPACREHVISAAGTECRAGCLVRRACPVGQGLRPAAQSAFHMAAFTGSAG